jgi:hypothetical protein
MGVSVPCIHSQPEPSLHQENTHVVVEQHQSLLGLLVTRLEPAEIKRRGLVRRVLSSDVLQQLPQDRRCPGVTRVSLDGLEQLGVPLLALGLGHGETLVDGFGGAKEVVRVDGQCGLEGRRRAHELGEDKRGFVGLVLAEDELHRSCVHAVSERGDEREVGNREEAKVFVPVDGLVAFRSARVTTN